MSAGDDVGAGAVPVGRGGAGYAVWRLIAEELRTDIAEGRVATGEKLPTEGELAERFAVNRHTVRQAVAALVSEGLVVSRRGSGSFVQAAAPLVHRIGLRTRLGASLGERAGAARAQVLEHRIEPASAEVARALRLVDAAPAQAAGPIGVLRIEAVRHLDGRPVSRSTHWFPAALAEALPDGFAASGSITAALREAGVEDYLRASTSISARHATTAESADLELEPGAVVLVARSVDVLPDGTPIQFGITRFAAQRVVLDIDHDGPPPHRISGYLH